MSARDRIERRLMPRLLVALSTIRWPGRLMAFARRALGRRARVDLYIAFDDPYSAVALLELVDRVARRKARVAVEPVVRRGIPDDPAVDAKRSYAITDARRLARRAGLELSRTEPLSAADTAFLAEWAASVPGGPQRTAFAAAAMHRVWFASDGPVTREPYDSIWREHIGSAPPQAGAEQVREIERRMSRRRMYDTPAALVHGQWFFAHERLAAIEYRLDELGWAKS
jgi:2-hydroxychromene-2-carboxylate isomerase